MIFAILFKITCYIVCHALIMAFFSISRYTGDGEGEENEKKSQNILQKLHEAAKKRKRSSQKFSESDASPESDLKKLKSVDAEPQTPKGKAKKTAEYSLSTSPDGEDKKHKDKKKKTKKVTPPVDSESDTSEDKNETINLGEASTMDIEDDSEIDEDQDTSVKAEDSTISTEPTEEAFTILGQTGSKQLPKVDRVLPKWLAKPSVITDDIRNKRTQFSEVTGLSDDLVTKLKDNGIKDFFPVQGVLIPELLSSFRPSYIHGTAGFRPSDICCSAPTGSGKTLAYVLPLVQALRSRVVPQVRVLVVLPVRDLATQVHKVFTTYTRDTPLKVGLILGNKSFSSEQQLLVRRGLCGYESQCDILISTPGRLVDHINNTAGFTLRHLRFLVVDEADRMIDEVKQDWLRYVEGAVYSSAAETEERAGPVIYGDVQRVAPPVLTVGSACQPRPVLQKLLFSATLSQNPEKLQQLGLFQPKLFTSVVHSGVGVESDKQAEFIGKFTTPSGLAEFYVEANASQKPLMMCRFLQHFRFQHMLCFTNSVDSAHRLYWLLKLTTGLEIREVTSRQLNNRRNRILRQFSDGKVDVLVCSDAMARGIDFDNVKYVVSYDSPTYLKTYIHRVGRTARAGKVGTAITLLDKKEVHHFKKMMKEGGKAGVKEMKVTALELRPYIDQYTAALNQLKEILQSEAKTNKR